MPKGIPEASKPLKNMRYERFALAVIRLNGNASAAYHEVYPRANPNCCRVESTRLSQREDIRARIAWLTERALRAEHMSANEVLREMARIGRVDIGDLVWKPGELDSAGNTPVPGTRKPLHELPEAVRRCVKSIKLDEEGRWEIQLWNKDAQLTNIAKHHKLIGGDVTVNVQLGFSERLRAAREKRLKESK